MELTQSSPSTNLFWPMAPARHRTGVRLFRLVVGLTFLYQLGILYGQREFIFGVEGLAPYADFVDELGVAHFSLLALNASDTWFQLVYHGTLLVLGLWTAGYATRLTTPLVWLGVHSIHSRYYALWDGGDNLMHIVLLFALLLDLRPADVAAKGRSRAGDDGIVGVRDVLHNVGLLACALQVCTVYVVAGMTKLGGKYWINGTAFYYVLNSSEFGFSSFAGPMIWNSPVLLTGMTWAPVVMQLAFPFIYLFGSPMSRRVLVLTAISFHLGIFFLMGLETFAMFMIAAELLLLSDDDYAFLRRAAVRAIAAPRTAYRALTRRPQEVGA